MELISSILGPKKRNEESKYSNGLKVIGSGFGRTGTSSTKHALEILYNAPCYHMSEVISNDYTDFWIRMAKKEVDIEEIREHFKHFAATVDFPACSYYRELKVAFPDAKILHNTREPNSWYKSASETIFNFQIDYPNQPIGIKIVETVLPFWRRFATLTRTMWGPTKLGPLPKFSSKDDCICAFVEWQREVVASYDTSQLLLFDVIEGWNPLCKFLQLEEPSVDFPNVNDSANFRKILRMVDGLGYGIFVMAVATVSITAYKLISKK